MAATKLIALHINKGKTVAQCLADRTDYSENAAKTEDGKYISAYACDAKTCDEEFLLSKRQYEHITGIRTNVFSIFRLCCILRIISTVSQTLRYRLSFIDMQRN